MRGTSCRYRKDVRPKDQPILATDLAGLALQSPLIAAAGTAGTLDELADVLDLRELGAITTKSITREPREGNQPWRITGLPAGMLNAIGLANPGGDAFVAGHAPRIAAMPCRVICSVAGNAIDDYAHVADRLDTLEAVAGVELNVSCPNVHGGSDFATDTAALADLVRAVRPLLPSKRLIVKLAPLVMGTPSIADAARAAIEPPGSSPSGPNSRPGADALTIANTVPAMAIDVHTRAPILTNTTGGLSGPAIHPITLKLVRDAYTTICRDAQTPIIAAGGTSNWQSAAAYILAGATALQLGTSLFADPRTPRRIAKGLADWVRTQGESSLAALTGALRV